MNACLICRTRTALPRTASVLQLCQRCTDSVFPGTDMAAYEALRTQYGWVDECTCGQCYACRRAEIDAKALAIVERERRICAGMMTPEQLEAHAWGQAQKYRCNAINALALQNL